MRNKNSPEVNPDESKPEQTRMCQSTTWKEAQKIILSEVSQCETYPGSQPTNSYLGRGVLIENGANFEHSKAEASGYRQLNRMTTVNVGSKRRIYTFTS